jgi:hypothetical protein
MLASDINDLTFFPIGAILQFSGSEYSRLTSARTADNKAIWTLCDGTSVNGITVPNLVDKFLRGSLAAGASGGADSRDVFLAETNLPSHTHETTSLTVGNLDPKGLSIASSGEHTHSGSGSTGATGSGGHTHTVSGTTGEISGSNHATITNEDGSNRVASGRASLATNTGANSWNATGDSDSQVRNLKIDFAHTHTFSGSTANNDGTHSHNVSITTTENGGSHSHAVTGSITGGSVGGTLGSAGEGRAFSVNTVPSYYSVVYIMKVA